MSLSTTTNKVIYSGDGANTVWPFSFPVLDADHLGVIFTDAAGAETAVAASAYAVTGIGAPAGGSVTYPLGGAPIPSNTKLTLVRTVPYTQDTVLSNQGGYYPEVVERRFDEIYMALQQLEERLGRARLSAISNPVTEQSNLLLIQQLQSMDALHTKGDLLTHDGSAYQRLPRGSANHVLGGGTDLAWREMVMPVMHIHGLTYSRNGGNAIDIALGGAMSEDGTDWLSYAGAAGIEIDTAFGSGNGALDTGSIANADYWIHLVKNILTGSVKPLVSLSRTAPSMPVGYTKRRVFGWLKRSAGSIVDFQTLELSGGGLHFDWVSPPTDVNVGALGAARNLFALSVPDGVSVSAGGNCLHYDATQGNFLQIVTPFAADVATTGVHSTVTQTVPVVNGGGSLVVRTNNSKQIAIRPSASTHASIHFTTRYFEWSRR